MGDLDLPWSAGFRTMFLCFAGDNNFAVTELCVSAGADDGEWMVAPIEVLFFFRSFFFRTMAYKD
jgi:hypothetical protein